MKRRNECDFIKIGRRIKDVRDRRGLTLDEVSKRAGLSKGLLSRVENFRSIPSLSTLAAVAKALNVDMGDLVRGVGGGDQTKPYVLTKADERERVDRDDAIDFLYESLGSKRAESSVVEAFALTLSRTSERKPVTTDGTQFIYILQGNVDFDHGGEILSLSKGDALFFDGRVPHAPKCVNGDTAVLLAIYVIDEGKDA